MMISLEQGKSCSASHISIMQCLVDRAIVSNGGAREYLIFARHAFRLGFKNNCMSFSLLIIQGIRR